MILKNSARVIAIFLAVALFVPFLGNSVVYSANPIGDPLTIVFLQEGKTTTWEGWFVDPCSPLSLTILKSDGKTQISIPAADLKQIHAEANAAVGFEAYTNPSAFFYIPFAPSGLNYELNVKRGFVNFVRANPMPTDYNLIPMTVADTLEEYAPRPSTSAFGTPGWYYITSNPEFMSGLSEGLFRIHLEFSASAPPTPSTSPSPTPTPSSNPQAGAIDLVFCIDTTGSMADDIDEVKDQARMIINTLASQTSDFRIGVIGFKDIGSSPPDEPIFQDFPFTSNVDTIISNINALTADGGGDDPEAVYEALLRAMDNVTLGQWRNGVGKIIILMGDAPPHERGEVSQDGTHTYQYTVSDVATVAQNLDPVHIFPVLTGGASDQARESFKQIATLTGGQVFEAEEASKVPQVISSVISTAVVEVSRVFPDISGHWAQAEIEKMSKIGILKGFPDGFFKPDQMVTRAQFAKVITIALRIPEVKPDVPTFPDVGKDHWAFGYIEAAVKRGLLKGFPDGTFRPEDQVSKPQIIKIIAQENGWTSSPGSPSFSDIGKDHWAFPFVEGAFSQGVLRKPDPNINQSDSVLGDVPATRAQACVLVYRMMEKTGAFGSTTPTPSAFRISKAVVCTQLDAENKPVNPGTSFPSSSTSIIYCWLSYEGATPNVSQITCKWYIEGEALGEPTTVIAKQASGTAAFHIQVPEGTFPPGDYFLELFTDGKPAMTIEFSLT
ncbi:MAG: S-layer homology domain-containing protein [Caldiserica bacterium]|jgi:hypothetical protein|nr:S-layer homology domain-containing protein [Caldisericota bacterium]MDH7562200.1 S-layer homology domain-containing protein [Caldisericota bacterium]